MAAAAQGLAALSAAPGLDLADLWPNHATACVCRNVAVCVAPPARTCLHELPAGSLRPGGNLLPGQSQHLVRPGDRSLNRVASQAYRGGW